MLRYIVIDKVYQEAHQVTKMFESELERTLIDEPEEKEQKQNPIDKSENNWANMVESSNNETMPTLVTQIPLSHLDPARITEFKPASTELDTKSPSEVDIYNDLSSSTDSDDNMFEPKTEIVPMKGNSKEQTIEDKLVTEQTEPNDESILSKKAQLLKKLSEPPSVFEINTVLPASSVESSDNFELAHTSSSQPTHRPGSPISVQTNSSLPMSLERAGEFSFKGLMGYAEVMKKLNNVPDLSANPTAAEYRAMRAFITDVVVFVNHHKLRWVCVEPMLMSQVVIKFPPTIKQNWGLMTVKSSTFVQLRQFLANCEEFTSQGWMKEISDLAAASNKMAIKNSEPFQPAYSTVCWEEYPPRSSTPGGNNKKNSSRSSSGTRGSASTATRGGASTNLGNYESPKVANFFNELENTKGERHAMRFDQHKYDWQVVKGAGKRSNDTPVMPSKKVNVETMSQNSNELNQSTAQEQTIQCLGCFGPHPLFKCKEFLEFSYQKRWEVVNNKDICPLCMVQRHRVIECSRGPCKRCRPPQPHNSTLCITGFRSRHGK